MNWDKDQVIKEIEGENEEIRRLKEESLEHATSTYFSRMQLGRSSSRRCRRKPLRRERDLRSFRDAPSPRARTTRSATR